MCSSLIYVKLLLSFCSVMFFCLVPCHFPLSLFSVMLFCFVLLPSSFDVFIWHSVVVVYSRVSLLTYFLTWTRKGMREEGRMRRRRRSRRRRSGLHTNSNNPTLKGGEQTFCNTIPQMTRMTQMAQSGGIDCASASPSTRAWAKDDGN